MSMSRREFLKTNTAAALGMAAGGSFLPEFSFPFSGASSHGGTDYLELKLFVEADRNRTQTPLDV
jgi:hypothetical protein